jgi:DNA topoisomerase-2
VLTPRQTYWLRVYDADLRKLKNQYRFVSEIIDGKLVVSKKKKDRLIQELRDKKYEAFPPKAADKKAKSTDEELDAEDEQEDDDASTPGAKDYDYLLSVSTCILAQQPTRCNAYVDIFLRM